MNKCQNHHGCVSPPPYFPGGMIGGILFLFVTLIIRAINDSLGMSIPINLQIAENLRSPVLLVILIGFSIALLWWKVETTPLSEPEIPESPVQKYRTIK